MMWMVRPMRQEDLDAVSVLSAQCFSQPWTRQALSRQMEQPSAIALTAVGRKEDGSEWTGGFCHASSVLDEAELCEIAVRPEDRGSGAALALLERLELECGARGISRLLLEVREGNLPAVRLYEKRGFARTGLRKNYYTSPCENAVLMEKSLIPVRGYTPALTAAGMNTK